MLGIFNELLNVHNKSHYRNFWSLLSNKSTIYCDRDSVMSGSFEHLRPSSSVLRQVDRFVVWYLFICYDCIGPSMYVFTPRILLPLIFLRVEVLLNHIFYRQGRNILVLFFLIQAESLQVIAQTFWSFFQCGIFSSIDYRDRMKDFNSFNLCPEKSISSLNKFISYCYSFHSFNV